MICNSKFVNLIIYRIILFMPGKFDGELLMVNSPTKISKNENRVDSNTHKSKKHFSNGN